MIANIIADGINVQIRTQSILREEIYEEETGKQVAIIIDREISQNANSIFKVSHGVNDKRKNEKTEMHMPI